MASVTGKTSIKIDDLINDTIIDGELVNGHLILRNRAGAEIDAGVLNVDSATILQSMPVGYVYISVDPTSPATLFGAGTWQRIAQGRMLVGQDPSQTEFDTVEETGGEKTHTLTTGELPAHTHAIDHDHPTTTSSANGNHTHTLERKTAVGTSTGVARGGTTASADGTTAAVTDHTHTVDIPAFSGASGSVGSGTAHNNLPPYLVVYMWKRVA